MGASCGNHLHLATLAASRGQAKHFALDETGAVVGPLTSLPLARIEAIGTCTNSVVISGRQENETKRSVLRLNARGEIIWQDEFHIAEPLMVSPKLTCVAERFFLVWAAKSEASKLCVVTVNGESLGAQLEFEFDDLIFDLRAVATERALNVACIHGHATTTLELILIAGEEIAKRVTITDAPHPVSPNLVVAGGELILFWLTKPEHELRAQHFDEALQPLGPANVIASTNEV